MINDDKCMINQSLLFHRVGEGRSNANSRMAQQLRVPSEMAFPNTKNVVYILFLHTSWRV